MFEAFMAKQTFLVEKAFMAKQTFLVEKPTGTDHKWVDLKEVTSTKVVECSM